MFTAIQLCRQIQILDLIVHYIDLAQKSICVPICEFDAGILYPMTALLKHVMTITHYQEMVVMAVRLKNLMGLYKGWHRRSINMYLVLWKLSC